MSKLTCNCGGKDLGPDHLLSEGTCYRKLATGNLIPTNFRVEGGISKCDVNGDTITLYTLKEQRMYYQHPTGDWSLLKSEDSCNSLDGE